MKKRFLTTGYHIISGIILVILYTWSNTGFSQNVSPHTYCNPVNLDYTYMIYNSHQDLSYRSGADPAVVEFRDGYYMFVTRSMGYWHSKDLLNWEFIDPEQWFFMGSNAPAAFNYKDSVLYMAGDPSGSMSILYTDDPKSGEWKATPGILHNLQDPALFIDDDGQAYMFWGSSNKFPIRVKRLDKDIRFKPRDEEIELFNLDEEKHGWERFGEDHSDTLMEGYIEGAWMTKYNDRYYLQYGAPGTEFNVYADGVYVSDDPLGPYKYAPNNPVSYKPGGFATGAGHGSSVLGPQEHYWHFATMALSVNVNWERRIVMYPMWFDDEGLMVVNTYFGDYPHYAPKVAGEAGEFTGWMLLSYDKPVKVSSHLPDHGPKMLTDEDIQTFWVAQENNDEQWIEIDLEDVAQIYAIQVNYHDYESELYGRIPELYHRYLIEGSTDGNNWNILIDKQKSWDDTPNDYVELYKPVESRYIRFRNVHAPMTNLAISDLRVFGKGQGNAPGQINDFKVERQEDRRNAFITWKAQPDIQGYNVLWGIAPDKLYSSWMVYGENELFLRALSVDQQYWFAIEAFNENGISERTETVKAE